jgi:hypothetical protein
MGEPKALGELSAQENHLSTGIFCLESFLTSKTAMIPDEPGSQQRALGPGI